MRKKTDLNKFTSKTTIVQLFHLLYVFFAAANKIFKLNKYGSRVEFKLVFHTHHTNSLKSKLL